MACPFCLQSLIFLIKEDFKHVKEKTAYVKFKFCVDFEKEMQLERSNFSDNVFDYIFNLFFVKPAFEEIKHKQMVNDFMSLDFSNSISVNAYIENSYQEIILANKKYIMELFKIDHDDPIFAAKVFQKNIRNNIEIISKGIF